MKTRGAGGKTFNTVSQSSLLLLQKNKLEEQTTHDKKSITLKQNNNNNEKKTENPNLEKEQSITDDVIIIQPKKELSIMEFTFFIAVLLAFSGLCFNFLWDAFVKVPSIY